MPKVVPFNSKMPLEAQINTLEARHGVGAFLYTPCSVKTKDVPIPEGAEPMSKAELQKLNDYGLGLMFESQLPYNHYGRLNKDGALVYEDIHSSDKQCNRTSGGITAVLEVFKTRGKGWGVRAQHAIQVGDFVCEFAGLLAPTSGLESDNKKEVEYCFNANLSGQWFDELLEEVSDDADRDEVARDIPDQARAQKMLEYSGLSHDEIALKRRFKLDARLCGNVGRFINHHRGDPNLYMQPVCSEHRDPRQPKLCLFAMRDIPQYEELTYDYGEGYENTWLNQQ